MSETLTVGELCEVVSAAVDEAFGDEIWVRGAISSLSRSQNGHVYFDLIDPAEVGSTTRYLIPVALFASSRHRVNAILRRSGNVRMHDGVEIRIRGQVAYYPPQGRVQLVMSLIDPAFTVGQMATARQVLLDKLAEEDLLAANGARSIPAAPLRVGLVTSDGSAAHADFAHELAASGYGFDVRLYDARVQGIDAIPSLVDAVERAGRSEVDVVVLVRGGGAKTDLAAFDHERVARAIAACERAVIVGVGHEVDRSVADEVAHSSAKTPTAAAALLVEAVARFEAAVEAAAGRLSSLATSRLEGAETRLAMAGGRLELAANAATDRHNAALTATAGHIHYLAVQALDRAVVTLDQTEATIGHRSERVIDRASATLDRAEVTLRALDPARALARGWSITHTADGDLVRGPDDASPGSTIVTTTAAGTIESTVVESTVVESTVVESPAAANEDREE
ncbi:MAG: exodeoxyribonuclease VII large subunit [Acidimicrobiales bacterium]